MTISNILFYKKGDKKMLTTINRQLLLETIQNLSRAVASKATIPVLEGIFIEAKQGKLKMIAYNLELGMTKEIEANVKEEGSIVINAKMLSEMIRRLSGVNVTLSTDDKLSCKIESDKTVFELMGMNPNDFPELPDVDETYGVTIPSDVLKDMVRQTIFSIAQPEYGKPIYTGLLFDIKDRKLTVVGVDGSRLAVRKEKIDYEGDISFIVAGRAIGEVVKIVKDNEKTVTINVGKRHFSITVDGYTIISRIMEGDFINYEKIVNNTFSTVVTANAKDIASIIDRISLVINDQLRTPVRCFMARNEFIFSCVTPLGKAIDSCECKIQGNEMEIGFNSKFLVEALKATECEEVKLNFNGPLSPMLILPTEGDSFVYIVMPMMLRSDER